MISVIPQELHFPFEVNKQISCNMKLTNNTDNYVAFKVKTTCPKKYCVKPNIGIVMPKSTHDILVKMQGQKEAPVDMLCKDKFMVQSVITTPDTNIKDLTADMFFKESGNVVDECKLKVFYVSPPQPPPAATQEGSKEDSDEGTVSNNRNTDTFVAAPISQFEMEDNLNQTNEIIARLMEEKNSTIQQSNKLMEEKNSAIQQSIQLMEEKNKLQQERDLLRQEISKKKASLPFMYGFIVGLTGTLLGYLLIKLLYKWWT